jgi:hypothetical protein
MVLDIERSTGKPEAYPDRLPSNPPKEQQDRQTAAGLGTLQGMMENSG